MGSGGGFIDYDGDGRLDIYLVNGATLPGYEAAEVPRNALFQNINGTHFERRIVGAEDTTYGMGAVAADYDNDGDQDLYLTNFGANILYRNEGGRFVDVTGAAGTGDSTWSASAAFLDYDNDGQLDLYVTNYIDFTVEKHRPCYDRGLQVYCDPGKFDAVPDRLYRNQGDGNFVDVTEATVVGPVKWGRGLGVTCADYDRDGWLDIYVANDETPNHLLHNEGGRLRDTGLFSGVSHSGGGEVQAGMGTHFGDFDGDGYADLFVTNFSFETYALYRNLGDGFFADATSGAGLAGPTLLPLGFGTAFLDVDNDGDQDLFAANGHVLHNINELEKSLTYKLTNQLFRNDGGRFVDASAQSGPAFQRKGVSRGAAWGDVDDDGDVDLLITNCNGAAELWRNEGGNQAHWLSIRPRGRTSNRDGIGARIEIWAGGRRQVKEAVSGGSYLAANDLRVHFGLGEAAQVEQVEIYWPGGHRDRWTDLAADQFLILEEGGGRDATAAGE
ncbi:MAG: hypothetical protein GKR89_10230 [Candidatus Latescibacteria bacterium]|nr:hypothetical protein [Candidatus Latescibacterota bacterium]